MRRTPVCPATGVLHRRIPLVLVALVTWALLLPVQVASAEGTPVTYKGFAYPTKASATPSADKPQSKLWHHDGAWWALMAAPSGAGINIFELRSDHTWRDTGVTTDTRLTSTADALWADNGKLYVASRTGGGALRLYRFSYSSANRSYIRDSGFPVKIADGGTETLTVARDSTGRLWMTWTKSSTVFMSYSTTSDTAWAAPVAVPAPDVAVASDDISAVIAFGDQVGIMWSDQASSAFRFAVHSATASPTSGWTMETPLSGTRYADDHLNLKSLLVDDAGRVHAAVKTSRGNSSSDSASDPLIMVLSRDSAGAWSQAVAAQVSSGLTRPQLALDSTNKDLYVLMTTEGGGKAYYKKAALSNVTFEAAGTGTTFMAADGADINNVSTTKQPVTAATGLVAIASADNIRTYFHTEMSLGASSDPDPDPGDTTAPTTPTNVAASATSSESVDLSWGASSDDVGVAGYTVYRDGTKIGSSGTTAFTDTTAMASTTYSYSVDAFDAAGNVSATSEPVTVTTPEAPTSAGIAFRSSATGVTTGSKSVTVARPAGVASGDALVASITVRGVPTVTAPSGWTLVRNDANSTVLRQAVYVKIAGSSEPTSYTWTFSASKAASGQILSYSGVSSSTAVDGSAASVNGSSTSIASPSVNASVPATVVVRFHGIVKATSIAPPAGYAERSEAATTGAKYPVTGESADTTQAAAGGTGTATAKSSHSGRSIGHTVVLRPAG